jgi:HK97 family phage portal protein
LNWFSRTFEGIAKRAVSFWSDKLSWGGLVSSGGMANSGVMVSPDRALGLTSYFAAINRISTDTASLPLRLCKARKGGGRDEIRDDVRAELLGVSPDGETTSMRWRQAWLGHALGAGNGYAEIEFSFGGDSLGYYLLDPNTTFPDRKLENKKLYYRTPKGTLPPNRVLHIAGLGFNGLKGYSVAAYHREAIGLGIAAERAGGAFFGNGCRLSGVLELPYKLKDKAAVDLLKAGWNNDYSGADNHGKVAVLEQGAKYSALSIKPEDAQYIQTRQFQVLEIARMFGIPPHKIGDYSQAGSAYRALEETNLDYLTTTIRPWCEQIEQELNRKLLTSDERRKGYFFEHDFAAFLRGDSKSRVAVYQGLFGMSVLSPNDICTRESLNPIGPDGDIRFVANNYTTLEKAKALPPPSPAPPADPPPSPEPPDDSVEDDPANKSTSAS